MCVCVCVISTWSGKMIEADVSDKDWEKTETKQRKEKDFENRIGRHSVIVTIWEDLWITLDAFSGSIDQWDETQ